MKQEIYNIFQQNRELLKKLQRALVYFREQEYEKALMLASDMIEEIRSMTDAVIEDRQYFKLVSTESVLEMLTGIINAKKDRDYVLLADLLELQLESFIFGVQELIVSREDFSVFDEREEFISRERLKAKLLDEAVLAELFGDENVEYTEKVLEEIDAELLPEELLKSGYRVEFTTCGEMTVSAPDRNGNPIYLHSNHGVTQEALLLAKKWLKTQKKRYVVYGFGMGYHVRELLRELPEDCAVEVYESDRNLLKLACAFSDIGAWMEEKRLRLIYDPECNFIAKRLQKTDEQDAVCIHYPSLCCVKDEQSREMLLDYLPWARRMEKY